MKKYLVLSLLLSTASNNIFAETKTATKKQKVQTQRQRSFFDSFFDEIDHMRERMQKLEQAFFEDIETREQKTQKADAVKLNIEQNQNQVIIKLNLENLNADQLKDLDVKDNIVYGTIPTENGEVSLAITNNYIEVAQRAKIKRQDKEGKEKEYLSQYWSSHQATTLPARVNLDTIKAEIQGNSLVITIDKKTPKKIAIANNKKLPVKQQPTGFKAKSEIQELSK